MSGYAPCATVGCTHRVRASSGKTCTDCNKGKRLRWPICFHCANARRRGERVYAIRHRPGSAHCEWDPIHRKDSGIPWSAEACAGLLSRLAGEE